MRTPAIILAIVITSAASAREYHVAVTGNDTNNGSNAMPLKTISAAANLAQPGDVITVHAGIYRERVNPPRGGRVRHETHHLSGRAGEKVVITGSEPVKGWEKTEGDTWKVTIPNKFFGGFNPYSDLIRGDWFDAKGRQHHTGAVYLNGDWLTEAAKLDEVLSLPAIAAVVCRGGGRHHHDLGAVPGREPQRSQRRDQRPQDRVHPGQDRHQLHHRARLHPAQRRHQLGAAHGRADRPRLGILVQRLDHREQRHRLLEMLRRRAGQVRRRMGQHAPTRPRATSSTIDARADRTAGTRRPSAATSSATTTSTTASRPASSAAWAARSAP